MKQYGLMYEVVFSIYSRSWCTFIIEDTPGIRLILWEAKIYYTARNIPPIALLWNNTEPVFVHLSCLLHTFLNVIISFVCRCCMLQFISGFIVVHNKQF
jgi:hypothetical protein